MSDWGYCIQCGKLATLRIKPRRGPIHWVCDDCYSKLMKLTDNDKRRIPE